MIAPTEPSAAAVQDVAIKPAPDTGRPGAAAEPASAEPDVIDDVLVETVSIDGMCGVY
jgi:mycofactocin precursor